MNYDIITLHTLLARGIDEDGLRRLCFNLSATVKACEDLDVSQLEGSSLVVKLQSVISYCRKRKILTALIEQIVEIRRSDVLAGESDAWRDWATTMDVNAITMQEHGIREAQKGITVSGEEGVIIVSKTGRFDYQTVAEAVKNATAGSLIVIKPGVYMEEILVDKPLAIVSASLARRVIIMSITAPCVDVQAGYLEIRGLIVRRLSDGLVTSGREGAAISITGDNMLIDNCNISSEAGPCLVASGSHNNLLVRGSMIHSGANAGVIFGNGNILVEDSTIYSNRATNVIIEHGNCKIDRCSIFSSMESGIQVGSTYNEGVTSNLAAEVVMNDSTVFDNGGHGIMVTEDSSITASRCNIFNNKFYGFYVDGVAHLSDSSVFGNKLGAIFSPSIEESKVSDTEDEGKPIITSKDKLGPTARDLDTFSIEGVESFRYVTSHHLGNAPTGAYHSLPLRPLRCRASRCILSRRDGKCSCCCGVPLAVPVASGTL